MRFLNICLRGEWNGPWSERSWEWDSLSERDKELLSVRWAFSFIIILIIMNMRCLIKFWNMIIPLEYSCFSIQCWCYSCRVRNEGEFWMSFDDFAKQFSHLDLVHIGPDDWMSEPALHRFWKIFFELFLDPDVVAGVALLVLMFLSRLNNLLSAKRFKKIVFVVA